MIVIVNCFINSPVRHSGHNFFTVIMIETSAIISVPPIPAKSLPIMACLRETVMPLGLI